MKSGGSSTATTEKISYKSIKTADIINKSHQKSDRWIVARKYAEIRNGSYHRKSFNCSKTLMDTSALSGSS